MSIASQVFDELAAMERCYEIVRPNIGKIAKTSDRESVRIGMAGLALSEPAQLAESALVWIAPEMVDLLKHAAASLPLYAFRPDVMPWPKAICFAAKPLVQQADPEYDDGRKIDITAVQWSDSPHEWHIIATLGRYISPDLLAAWETFTMSTGDSFEAMTMDGEVQPEREVGTLLCALWLLLKQKVAVQRKAIPTRGERRRWIRAEQGPLPDVTIVELRRPLNTEPFKGESGFVDWSHRWIVDGHWRNQYHPSTQEHVPTWIAPYVKGPDDKPLVVGRKVHAWTR